MQKERQKPVTRRNFLEVVVVTGVAAVVTYIVDSLGPLGPDPSDLTNGVIRRGDGIIVHGEDKTFEYNGRSIRTCVNTGAFATAILAIAEAKQKVLRLQNFQREYPMRIALYTEPLQGPSISEYAPAYRVPHPHIRFHADFIRRYLDALLSDDNRQIRNMDEHVCHEMLHYFQDAMGIFPAANAVETGIKVSTIGIAMKGGEQLADSIYDESLGLSPLEVTARKILYPVAAGLGAWAINDLAEPATSITEREAYSKAAWVMSLPSVAPYRGMFFDFETVP